MRRVATVPSRVVSAYLAVALALVVAATLAAPLKFPALTGRVVDEAGVLSPQARAYLEARLARHEQATREQVVVATLADLQGVPIEDFGVALGRHWGIGQRKENTGALVLIAPKERATRIEVGYGLEGRLTDAVTSDIVQRYMLPAFRAGDLEAGIVRGTDAVLAALGDTEGAAAPVTAEPKRALPLPFLLLVIAFWLLSGLRRHGRGLFGGGFGGFGGGGGGFGGGGGSFGGGGASGRW